MIPLAIIGWMHPVLAEIAMATSSVTVVTNANLLRRVNIQPSLLQKAPPAPMPKVVSQPGQRADLTVTFDANFHETHGEVTRLVWFATNDPTQP